MDLLTDLNPPQQQAVTHADGPLLVLAGAGSGKTRVITRRVAWLISQGVGPQHVLAITFTNKAAGEMRDRAAALGTSGAATFATFHALCARLLREFADAARVSPNYTIYDRDDQIRAVKQSMERLKVDDAGLSPQAIHSAISNAKNALQDPADMADDAGSSYRRTAADVYAEYERVLAANNALDFDDLLLRMALLLKNDPGIRRELSDRYRYVMIDEYQDTNHAQYIIAHTIAAPHKNMCVTGDPDQSIYAWRGADIRNILEFERDYPDAVVIRLEENYRSTAAILGAASRLIDHNVQRKDKALWTQREDGPDVHILRCDDEHAEAREVVRRMADAGAAGCAWGDIAVFYRLNSLSRLLEEALLLAGIPYRIARGVEFYNRKEIKDVLAYLRLLANPDDDLNCRRIINTPTRGIGATTLTRLETLATTHGLGLLAACREAHQAPMSAAAAKKVRAFAAMIDELAADIERPVHRIVESVLTRCGLEDSLQRGGEEGEQARANVGELVNAAAEFDARDSGGTLADYLHQISLVSDVDMLDQSRGAVTLMTLHAAKGLEFPVVFIVGCEEGLLPFGRGDAGPAGSMPTFNPADLEEERRLAFVGMTRAMDQLTLSAAVRRMVRGCTTEQAASSFLTEIGDRNVTREDLTTQVQFPRRPAGAGFYADIAERDAIESTAGGDGLHYRPVLDDAPGEGYPPEYEHLRAGCLVRHPTFGTGTLVSVKQPWPQTRAVIDFRTCGLKTIVLIHTRLELIESF